MGPKMVVFGENGVYMLNYQFGIHQKAHPCEVPRLLMFFCVKVGAGVLAVGEWKNPKKTEKKPRQRCARNRAYAQKRNPLSDLYKILRGDRHPRRNHPNKFWLRSVKGLLGGEGLNMPIPHRLPLSPLQNCRTTVRVCKVTKGPIR